MSFWLGYWYTLSFASRYSESLLVRLLVVLGPVDFRRCMTADQKRKIVEKQTKVTDTVWPQDQVRSQTLDAAGSGSDAPRQPDA
jgi:hypothetical protein